MIMGVCKGSDDSRSSVAAMTLGSETLATWAVPEIMGPLRDTQYSTAPSMFRVHNCGPNRIFTHVDAVSLFWQVQSGTLAWNHRRLRHKSAKPRVC